MSSRHGEQRGLVAQMLREGTLCARCERDSREVPAITFNTDWGLPLCHMCQEDAEQFRADPKGCDVDGYPLDPNHPWNQ
jgi:hypothetical protein